MIFTKIMTKIKNVGLSQCKCGRWILTHLKNSYVPKKLLQDLKKPSLRHISGAFWKCAHNLFFIICLINLFRYAYVAFWVSIERAMVDCFVFCAYEKCSYLIFELCIYPWQIINQICALFRPLLTKLPLQQMLWAYTLNAGTDSVYSIFTNEWFTNEIPLESNWGHLTRNFDIVVWVGSGHYYWIAFRLKSPWFV